MKGETHYCTNCGEEVSDKAEICPNCGVRQKNNNTKSNTAAGLFGILLGGIGAHKFYLGKPGWGILYLLFSWTFIPAIVGLIEGIVYLTKDEDEFNAKYVD